MHHYNAPSYSVGETGRFGSPGRREIGHGMLAEKAIMPVLPEQDKFPYVIRLVSEVLSQNGSSSHGINMRFDNNADGRRSSDQRACCRYFNRAYDWRI